MSNIPTSVPLGQPPNSHQTAADTAAGDCAPLPTPTPLPTTTTTTTSLTLTPQEQQQSQTATSLKQEQQSPQQQPQQLPQASSLKTLLKEVVSVYRGAPESVQSALKQEYRALLEKKVSHTATRSDIEQLRQQLGEAVRQQQQQQPQLAPPPPPKRRRGPPKASLPPAQQLQQQGVCAFPWTPPGHAQPSPDGAGTFELLPPGAATPGTSPKQVPTPEVRCRGAAKKQLVPVPKAVQGYPGRFSLKEEEQWKAFLQAEGWVVLADVADGETLDQFESNFWDYRERMGTGLVRDDPSGWNNATWGGHSWHQWTRDGAGQEQWMWDVRQHVSTVFEKIYRTPELVTSFEGFSAWRSQGVHPRYPPHPAPSQWVVDQSPSFHHFQCFQGFLNFYESGPEDGGFCVASGSKRVFTKMTSFSSSSHDSRRTAVTPAHYPLLKTPLKVNARRGDFVLWDSRTAYAYVGPPSGSVAAESQRLRRLAAHVCMTPAQQLCRGCPEKQVPLRRRFVEEGRTTTHHPWLCNVVPATKKDGSGSGTPVLSLAQYTPPILTPKMLRLAGLAPYSTLHLGTPHQLPYDIGTRDVRGIHHPAVLTTPMSMPPSPAAPPSPMPSPFSSPADLSVTAPPPPELLLSAICGGSPPSPLEAETAAPQKPAKLAVEDDVVIVEPADIDMTAARVREVWKRLAKDLSDKFIEAYLKSSRRKIPAHVGVLVAQGVSDPATLLKGVALQTVKEAWTSEQQQRLESMPCDKQVELSPLMRTVESAVSERLNDFVCEIQKNSNVVPRILESSLRKRGRHHLEEEKEEEVEQQEQSNRAKKQRPRMLLDFLKERTRTAQPPPQEEKQQQPQQEATFPKIIRVRRVKKRAPRGRLQVAGAATVAPMQKNVAATATEAG